MLPMVSHGPTLMFQDVLLMHWDGLIGICGCCCRWYRMGPLEYATAVANGFAWAHLHMRLLLPMASFWPIGLRRFYCGWYRMGPLV